MCIQTLDGKINIWKWMRKCYFVLYGGIVKLTKGKMPYKKGWQNDMRKLWGPNLGGNILFPCPKVQVMTVKSVMHNQWTIQMHLTFQARKDEKFHHNMHPRVLLGNEKM